MIRKLARQIVKVFWLLPGFLLWASFPPMGETTDCLFALAPLLWLSRQGEAKTSARRWFANGMLFWFVTLSWMPAIVKNGGPWPLVVLGWGALAAYCAAYFAAFGWLSAKYWAWARESGGISTGLTGSTGLRWRGYGERLFGLLFVEPVLWAGLELIRSRFLGGFAWNQLGVAPVNCGFGAPAVLGGVYLVSACVILINGTLASIAERILAPFWAHRRRKVNCGGQMIDAMPLPPPFVVPNWVRSVETLLPFLVVFGVYALAGRVVAREMKPTTSVQQQEFPGCASMKVAMVQRNFPCCFQGREENPVEVYSNLFERVSLFCPYLVVLSESALAEFGAIGRENAERFLRWASERTGACVLAGGGRRAEGHEYNSAVLYFPGRPPQIYDKVHLVPFGEFIPGDKWIPALQKLAPVGSCTPGKLKRLFMELPSDRDGWLGVAICFEDTDSAQMRRLAKMDAQLLVFITNDSWFSHSVEAVQHAWQARARAIETGLTVVRVGNSGVTGTITPDGRATWLVDDDGKPLVDRQGTMFDRVALPPICCGMRTPYVVLGDVPLALAFALLILRMILINYKGYAKRRSLSMQVR